MSDDEPNAVGPSPAKSVARSAVSVASTRKSTKESAVQAKVAAMSRPELEDGMIKLLTKLQAKEKLIKGQRVSCERVTAMQKRLTFPLLKCRADSCCHSCSPFLSPLDC